MNYLLWSLPALTVVLSMGVARVSASRAALLGLLVGIPVAYLSGPASLDAGALTESLSRGSWIGAVVAPYILGGLLFWQVAAQPAQAATDGHAHSVSDLLRDDPKARRRWLFFACFLVGPFAESATGFGVGMIGTIALLRRFNLLPGHAMVFALLSQTLIPWGGMGSGTLLAAAYARISPTQLALYALVPVSLLMLTWLPLFWRTARAAGFHAPTSERIREAAWIAAGLCLLAIATFALGPEIAMLAAFGPIIMLHYLLEVRPNRASLLASARTMLPFVVLILALVVTRLVSDVRGELEPVFRLQPYSDLPALSPLLHAGSWLTLGAVATSALRRRSRFLLAHARSVWETGRDAVLTVLFFSMMAEVLAASGISGAIATELFHSLGKLAVLVAPLMSIVLGLLANSGSAANSLFMPAQTALALQIGLSVPAVAALQHVSATSLGFYSPVRMSIAAGLCGGVGQERSIYARLFPYAAAGVLLMSASAVAVIALG